MTEMRRLADALAGADVSADEIYRWLRWWGFHGFTLGFQPFLEHVIVLESALQRLVVLYPNLQLATTRFLHAKQLQTRLKANLAQRLLETSPDIQLHERLEKTHLDFDTRAPIPEDQHSPDIDADKFSTRKFRFEPPVPIDPPRAVGSSGAMLMYTASFLLVHIYDGHAQLLNEDQFQGLRLAHEFFTRKHFPMLWDIDLPDLKTLAIEQCVEHVLERIHQISNQSPFPDGAIPRTGNQESFKCFTRLLQQANLFAHADLGFSQPGNDHGTDQTNQDSSEFEENQEDDEEEFVKQWGNGCSADLDDRALSLETRYGFSKRDRTTLAYEVHASIDQSREILRDEEQVIKQASPYSLNPALATGKTLSDAFQMRVVRTTGRDAHDHELRLPGNILTITQGQLANQFTTHWRTAQVEKTELVLPLEFQPPRWPEHCQDFEIHELFLLPPEVLLPKIESRLAARMHRTKKQLRLSTKHALARDMFSFNTNKAAIHFVCDPHERATESTVDVNTLIYYLHPRSLGVTNAYRYAQRRLLSGTTDDTLPKMPDCTTDMACMFINAATMRSVVKQMGLSAQAHDPSHIWRHHAQFAIYVAAFLEATTGHRECAQLFHFPFLVDEKELLAFIADKNVVGSEARFVALTEAAVKQFIEYRKHIFWLIEWVSSFDKSLAEKIKVSIGLLQPSPDTPELTVGMFFTYSDGILKSLSTEQIQEEMEGISRLLGHSDGVDFSAKSKRRNLITFLANFGASGMDLEVQLGHNGDQHLFGPASNWIPLERIELMRRLIDSYLETNGWKLIQASWVAERHKPPSFLVPQFESSHQAYEGRALSSDAARDRARAAIIAALPPIVDEADTTTNWDESDIKQIRDALENTHANSDDRHAVVAAFNELAEGWKQADFYEITPLELKRAHERLVTKSKHSASAEGNISEHIRHNELAKMYACVLEHIPPELFKPTAKFKFDEAKWEALRSDIQRLLPGDQAAHSKILSEFSKLAALWRQRGQYLVTATSINLARFAPGPVSPLFGRHLAIARYFKENLANGIADYFSKARGTNSLERLAVISVLLVAYEAVLNLLDLKQLIESIQVEDTSHFNGQYHVRAQITSKKAIYDRTVDLTSKTSAALFGYLESRGKGEYFSFEQIQDEANSLVQRIVEKQCSLNLLRLLEVMKPFWFLRLPGSTYSTCVGSLDSQAPSESSLEHLLGAAAEQLQIPEPTAKSEARATRHAHEIAEKETRDLLNSAKGQIELRESSSRSQRRRLRRTFSDGGDSVLINKYLSHQVVEYWVRFQKHLLAFGGPRVATYDFRTLVEYQSRILGLLYRHAWNAELTDLAADEFDALYNNILEETPASRQDAATTVLRLFHDFLRQTFGAPKCNITRSTDCVPRCARSVVIDHATFEQCINEVNATGRLFPEIGGSAAGVTAAHYVFGLRTKEAYGLLHKDFLEQDIGMLRVSRNTVRGLKTSERTVVQMQDASLRSTPTVDPLAHSILRLCFNQSKIISEPDGKTPVFPNRVRPDQLAPYAATIKVINWAIKRTTGDIDALPYSLRHSYATAVMSTTLMPYPVASSIAVKICESLPKKTYVGCGLSDRSNYPLQIDRLAMSLGQEGVGTLTNFYWHGAWWVAGEFCCRQELEEPNWKDSHLGALLGKEKSVIYKRRTSARTNGGPTLSDPELVRKYIQQGGTPLIARDTPAKTLVRTECAPEAFSLQSVDTLLVLIRQYENLEKVEDLAFDSYSIARADAKGIFEGYHRMRKETGFLDFEPDEFRLRGNNVTDVFSGEKKRRTLLALVEQYLGSSDLNALSCKAIVSGWCETFNPWTPVLLSHSTKGFLTQVAWLCALGYEKRNIRVLCNSAESGLTQLLREKADSVIMRRKLSRVADSRKPLQIGIELHLAGSLPNNSEFHRVMFALACCSTARLGWF